MNHQDENELALSPSKTVTLKDIAEWADVSLGTVHRALYGKKGVSEPLRQKILAIAQEAGYVPNQAASLLKRRRQRVFVLAPGPGMSNRYYYDNIWKGFRDYAEELSAFNIEIVELPYYRIAGNQIADELASALQRYNGEVDGLLASGFLNSGERQVIQNLSNKNIPVVIAADKIENVLANVYVDFDTTGRIAAELLSSQLPAG
ncbi:MAG: LacI family DNA-binding transcriptional regulator, partial [Oscillospiraceae bacterium]|nr:LacI family DNA-binding transcriptional regulator [Oscillospiraceae bacterium]